jgi:hypothetical protein
MAFRGLQEESKAQGRVHIDISKDLQALVADPFNDWAKGYKVDTQGSYFSFLILIHLQERLSSSKATVISNWLRAYEGSQKEVCPSHGQHMQCISLKCSGY